MEKKRKTSLLSRAVCGLMCASMLLPTFAGCGDDKGKKKDSVVIMTEELSGLFNPFYATAGADMDVVGMTQIGMLSTNEDGEVVAGDDLPTVVKDFKYETQGTTGNEETVYTFVIKNDLKFSDGKPLTMNDVMFNIYEYLDPVYTGSSTMYSIDIKGLSKYRLQKDYSDDTQADAESARISKTASTYAQYRIKELIGIYEDVAYIEGSTGSYSATEADVKQAINEVESVNVIYKNAIATTEQQKNMTLEDYKKQLLADYQFALDTFKKELESDYKAAKESFDLTADPYKKWAKELSNDIFKFFLYENYITPVYKEVNGKKDKTVIEKFEGTSIVKQYKNQKDAINRVYSDKTKTEFNQVLSYWGTAGTLSTQYTADATAVILRNNLQDGQLSYPNIDGVKSLAHEKDAPSTVSIGNKTYKVASNHTADGVPTANDEYDVLEITVNGIDPKAIFNFSFTVAPAHYYSADENYPTGRPINIAQNQFGVEWSDTNFQTKTIQSQLHVEVPVGAGAFKATNADNKDNPKGDDFWSSNIVYFKANDNFMFDVAAPKLRLQVVSSANAIDKLSAGEVDYITPQYTDTNIEKLNGLKSKGIDTLNAWQLGYGYIGINAGKVPDINIRRAIMSAMQTELAVEYYDPDSCVPINWPMSNVSWAYPYAQDGKTNKNNDHDYTQYVDKTTAIANIQKYMKAANVSANSSKLKVTFTIAGASITEHPTYGVFKQAAELLNSLGWDVEVKADSQALTKLATGSLQVWAAAWGSTIDPDMYQVYHKDSTATSVYAWGYREIKQSPSTYPQETAIIDALSKEIEVARTMLDQNVRKGHYETAMRYVLDLAVELPVYQRKNLFAYNSKRLTGLVTEVNEYSSPLERIWEVALV